MNKYLKGWLDYREYLYYYKIILLIFIVLIIEKSVNNALNNNKLNIGYLIRLVLEFMGIKYWVFKNKWSERKYLKKEIILFLLLKLLLYVMKPLFKMLKDVYKKLSLTSKTKKLIRNIVGKIKKYTKYEMNMENTMIGKILEIIYIFLTTSVVAYPIYRYVIFSPNKE